MINIFKALADETRLRILSIIFNGEMCVCEIEKSLGLTQSNASRHLTALKDAGILLNCKHAQWTYYKLNDKFIKNNKELYDYLFINLKSLRSYNEDVRRINKNKLINLCNDKIIN